MDKKRTWIERVNDHLSEPEGETFKRGKWRFWFPIVAGLTALNAGMTIAIFGMSSVSAVVIAIVGLAGALLCWLDVGNLHYSDSADPALAKNVSLLDSITLCFVIAHFCFLLYCLGHLITLRGAEADYERRATAYNEKARDVSGDNVKIAEAVAVAEREKVKAERLRNDTAYQQRKAAEAGAQIRQSKQAQGAGATSLSTSPVELERPEKPAESSVAFLAKWDALIRLANFGELILAAVTLIYIRNRSARQNAPYLSGNGPRINFATVAHTLAPQNAPLRQSGVEKVTVATVAEGRESALKILREHLGVIASYMPNRWFRADLIDGGVSIRLYSRNERGREKTIKQTRQSNKILLAVNRPDFRERLTRELIACGFPIEEGER